MKPCNHFKFNHVNHSNITNTSPLFYLAAVLLILLTQNVYANYTDFSETNIAESSKQQSPLVLANNESAPATTRQSNKTMLTQSNQHESYIAKSNQSIESSINTFSSESDIEPNYAGFYRDRPHSRGESLDSSLSSYTQDYNIDPYENFNRNSYRMNETLDRNFVRPATVWYITYIPNPVRAGVQNFFTNLRDFVTLGNDVLQLNTIRSVKDTMRVCVNSTVGILGLIDVSSHIGLPEHINTFGHTMRFYGWENSSYYMIPFLGPSTVRDAIGMIPDLVFNPTWWITYPYSNYVSVGLFMANGIDQRSKYLDFDQLLNASLDPYVTVRDFYLQNTGNMPEESNTSNNNVNIDSLLDD